MEVGGERQSGRGLRLCERQSGKPNGGEVVSDDEDDATREYVQVYGQSK